MHLGNGSHLETVIIALGASFYVSSEHQFPVKLALSGDHCEDGDIKLLDGL
jgi:hypothetical protein